MKKHFPFIVLFLVVTFCWDKANAVELPDELRPLVKSALKLDQDAINEIRDHVNACGIGVIEGQDPRLNECRHRISIDDWFAKPLVEKTGFKYNPDWPYLKGVEWQMPSKKEINAAPDQWDLKDHGDMIRIVRQKCGDCWGQASRANLEQLVLTHQGQNIPLSTQTLISRCCNTGTCGGGYMTTPTWIVENGLPILSRDPYQGKNSSCKFTLSSVKWDSHLIKAPYVGKSLNYSRALKADDRTGPKVKETMAMMAKYKSSAVVTIAAISSSGGIIKNCSSINSGGNHMQDIVGWYMDGNDRIARVQNSWGKSHGQNGYTHIQWECGDGRHNRGLGRSARVGVISMPVNCKALPEPKTGGTTIIMKGKSVKLGETPKHVQTCKWVPEEGLDDPRSCTPNASPKIATEYHLIAKTDCGEGSAMVLVIPRSADQQGKQPLLTPHGTVQWDFRS